jgi:EREBP-like factor
MCGGAILSGFIRPSGPAAKQQQQLLQRQPRLVAADLLWPGSGRKGAPAGDDFEADFREFVRGLGEDDDADTACGGDEVLEVPPPEPATFAFAAAAKAAPPAVGENRIKFATSFCFVSFCAGTHSA